VAKDSKTGELIRGLLVTSQATELDRFKRAPLPYPREFDNQIDQFVVAVKLVFVGEAQEARHRMNSIDHMSMVKWYDEAFEEWYALYLGRHGYFVKGGH
jgi:hypothetical protein